MKAIEYSRKDGFVATEFDEPGDGGEDEEHWVWLRRIGFNPSGNCDGLLDQRDYGYAVEIHSARNDATHGYAALVELSDGSEIDYVLVRSRAELLNLRMALLPFHGIALLDPLNRLFQLAEKAFHAWHGHYVEDDCIECNPTAVRQKKNVGRVG